ncbi:DUF2185 domain-containing protein [Glaciecola sp. MH2013]|uniref:DUF2185 domain-containing protein n=1 Tax=Glaciecola sp. MH2013 TaxID=2785524 RepID=UPI0018A00EAF|nr:DUF2185 domain-containing protein [Glaciecola sp. MH2013]MBF7074610.1 DUF2185 domain-containing protein [Glaciecola sp. MH2013]
MKNYKIPKGQMRSLAEGFGACLATDHITVEGRPVGYMYRTEPDINEHNGWVFMSGDESQEYADTAENWNYYDTNTIANYDPDIVKYLGAAIGSSFERDSEGKFIVVTD